MSEKIQKLLEEIASLTLLEAAELKKAMEEKFGVTAAAPVMAVAAGPAQAAEAAEEKTEFDVELTEIGAQKLNVIKALREIDQSLGLAEAKAKVESAPVIVMSGVKKEQAEEIKKKLEEAGAKVTLK
ncbi:MAG: 50S ribosomal protein L7/L12 [Candidatus Dojkabacteria bacterium]|nr:50S ribosomal protein L7/L12 [Candidatus Dojkabacteria bacterium]